jgi:hypothetical protein
MNHRVWVRGEADGLVRDMSDRVQGFASESESSRDTAVARAPTITLPRGARHPEQF